MSQSIEFGQDGKIYLKDTDGASIHIGNLIVPEHEIDVRNSVFSEEIDDLPEGSEIVTIDNFVELSRFIKSVKDYPSSERVDELVQEFRETMEMIFEENDVRKMFKDIFDES